MLLDINPGLIIWTIVAFLLTLFILAKVGWKPMIKALNQREEKIRKSLDEAKETQKRAEDALAKQQVMLSTSDREAQKVIQEARELAEKLRAEIREKANEEADRLRENAKREIERERDAAINQLRGEVVRLAIGAAEKVIASELDAEKNEKLVDKFIGEMPKGTAN